MKKGAKTINEIYNEYPYPSKKLLYKEFCTRQEGHFLNLSQSLKQRNKNIAKACTILSAMLIDIEPNTQESYAIQEVIDILRPILPRP